MKRKSNKTNHIQSVSVNTSLSSKSKSLTSSPVKSNLTISQINNKDINESKKIDESSLKHNASYSRHFLNIENGRFDDPYVFFILLFFKEINLRNY
jgi:hypothetical protein